MDELKAIERMLTRAAVECAKALEALRIVKAEKKAEAAGTEKPAASAVGATNRPQGRPVKLREVK